ncbi:glycine receptor subunit alpha-2-like [Dermacentor variabilis]|uniref:glycine receptor subunit alpha-2-like n=1 Tax=Dermacentor variabilis TaxID=34621 RepID=UPI003F5C58EC
MFVAVQLDDVSNFNERIMRFTVMMTAYNSYWAGCAWLKKASHPYARLPADNEVMNTAYDERAYRPDTFIEEAVNVQVVPSMERLENIYKYLEHVDFPQGDYCLHVMKARLNATIACLMNFRYFPMDTQTCTMTIRSYAYPKHILQYKWAGDNLHLDEDRLRVPEYHVTLSEADQAPSSENDGTTGEEYSRLRLHIRFRRRIQRHLVDTFVPTAFLVILSWLSFWLGTSATQPRVLLCSVVLVAALQHLTAAREGLPPSRSWTGLDIWTILCLGFVSASIVEVTYVCYCSDPAADSGNTANPNTGVRVGRFKETAVGISRRSQEREAKSRLTRLEYDAGGNQMTMLGPDERADKFCRTAFPVAFVVSNVIFWSWLYFNQEK